MPSKTIFLSELNPLAWTSSSESMLKGLTLRKYLLKGLSLQNMNIQVPEKKSFKIICNNRIKLCFKKINLVTEWTSELFYKNMCFLLYPSSNSRKLFFNIYAVGLIVVIC